MKTEVIGTYRKSSYSGGENNCIEVAVTADGGRAVRDSKDPAGPSLHFTPTEWAGFLAGTQSGAFDR